MLSSLASKATSPGPPSTPHQALPLMPNLRAAHFLAAPRGCLFSSVPFFSLECPMLLLSRMVPIILLRLALGVPSLCPCGSFSLPSHSTAHRICYREGLSSASDCEPRKDRSSTQFPVGTQHPGRAPAHSGSSVPRAHVPDPSCLHQAHAPPPQGPPPRGPPIPSQSRTFETQSWGPGHGSPEVASL